MSVVARIPGSHALPAGSPPTSASQGAPTATHRTPTPVATAGMTGVVDPAPPALAAVGVEAGAPGAGPPAAVVAGDVVGAGCAAGASGGGDGGAVSGAAGCSRLIW